MYNYLRKETIAAISTGLSENTAIGIIRISGPNALQLSKFIKDFKRLEPRFMTNVSIIDSEGLLLDRGLCCFFPSPNSYTSEDIIELYLHGNVINLRRILDLFINSKTGFAVEALPGEFTYRALLNGKLSFNEAMSINDLVTATDEKHIDVAIRQMQVKSPREYIKISEALLNIETNLEVLLDVEDVDSVTTNECMSRINNDVSILESVFFDIKNNYNNSVELRKGKKVVLTGTTNVGKSTLFNALLGFNRVIVSDYHGTTRDVVKESIKTKYGYIELIDTAGVRETDSYLEKVSQDIALEELSSADVILYLLDVLRLDSLEIDSDLIKDPRTILVLNKCDVEDSVQNLSFPHVKISAKDRTGIDELLKAIFVNSPSINENTVLITNSELLRQLDSGSERLSSFKSNIMSSHILAAEDLRLLKADLFKFINVAAHEDLLESMFNNFCVGK